MLPFLKPRRTTTLMVGTPDKIAPQEEQDPALMSAAEDVISAIALKDASALAKALKAAFQICDASPHLEGEHEDIAE